MSGPVRAPLSGGRWHYQHGPIDLVIGADGDARALGQAYDACWAAFQGLLAELVGELALLRAACDAHRAPRGATARAMHAACMPYAERFGLFVTPMAAVAGAVAQTLVAAFARPGVTRAYVNDGGDIALHLAPQAHYAVGVVSGLDPGAPGARLTVSWGDPVRGIATSGWRGRSFSLGIADNVTVLGASAAQADAAATMIANAVYVEDRAVVRVPANRLRDDTDLGERPVTTAVGTLSPRAVARALDAGAAFAREAIDAGLCEHALIGLQGRWRAVGARDDAIARRAQAAARTLPAAVAGG